MTYEVMVTFSWSGKCGINNKSKYIHTSLHLFVFLIPCNNDFFLADINKHVFADMHDIIRLTI